MDLKDMTFVILVIILQLGCLCFDSALGNVVLPVQHKFKGREKILKEMRAHDSQRHARLLASSSAVDIPLGGVWLPTEYGLYYTKIGLGTPSKDFYVQVDTGSDTLWVNCVGCSTCPQKSKLVKLTSYDPKGSSTGNPVQCADGFCTSTYNGEISGCKPDLLCQYNIVYGDRSSTAGYYVRDSITLKRATGSTTINGTIVFGCGTKRSSEESDDQALDGIIGFGQANSSMISQLAAANKVKKVFSHCLDGKNGGGIFAIGAVVQPKVKTTPIIPNKPHYNVNLKQVEVDGDVLPLSRDIFDSEDEKGVIVDSGTTLAYLPDDLHEALMKKILSRQPGLKVQLINHLYSCFSFSRNVDDAFPTVTFHFEGSLSLTVYPHDYMFRVEGDQWCVGWMSSGTQTKDGKDMTILGDFSLANKLVVYDLENQFIGWTEYNCSSKIKVKDDGSGGEYFLQSDNISSASFQFVGRTFMLLLELIVILHNLTF